MRIRGLQECTDPGRKAAFKLSGLIGSCFDLETEEKFYCRADTVGAKQGDQK